MAETAVKISVHTYLPRDLIEAVRRQAQKNDRRISAELGRIIQKGLENGRESSQH